MHLTYEEIEKYLDIGQIESLLCRLGLSSEDLLHPLLGKIASLTSVVNKREAEEEDQLSEIYQLENDIRRLQDELDNYKEENSSLKEDIAILEAL